MCHPRYMTHFLRRLDDEDRDTLKAGALSAAAGAVLGLDMAVGNAISGAATHRSALSAAEEEWNRIYGPQEDQ